MNIELGTTTPREGYKTVDKCPGADIIADLDYMWPFDKDSIDHIIASNIFEHLINPIFTMNELYRVLKPGGIAEVIVPSTDGRGAWQDPTHVSYWNINSFGYYSSSHNYGYWNLMKMYGGIECDFKILKLRDFELHDKIIMTEAHLQK